MKNNTIQQIVMSGLLTGVGILVGSFAHFYLFGQVYLIGIVVFLMPLFLRLDFLIVSTIASVTISDLVSGFGHYAWISAIVYGLVAIVLWLFSKTKLKLLYIVGLFISGGILVFGYFALELPVFGKDLAIRDSMGTAIEMAIVVPIVSILYFPMKVISKTLVK